MSTSSHTLYLFKCLITLILLLLTGTVKADVLLIDDFATSLTFTNSSHTPIGNVTYDSSVGNENVEVFSNGGMTTAAWYDQRTAGTMLGNTRNVSLKISSGPSNFSQVYIHQGMLDVLMDSDATLNELLLSYDTSGSPVNISNRDFLNLEVANADTNARTNLKVDLSLKSGLQTVTRTFAVNANGSLNFSLADFKTQLTMSTVDRVDLRFFAQGPATDFQILHTGFTTATIAPVPEASGIYLLMTVCVALIIRFCIVPKSKPQVRMRASSGLPGFSHD